MASGLTSSSEPLEPDRVWTAEEWDNWMSEPSSNHRKFRKSDMFRRMYSPVYETWGPGFDVEA